MKKCPFRKDYVRGDYNCYGHSGVPLCDYREEFQDCIGQDCMAYALDYTHLYREDGEQKPKPICLLMRKGN